MTARDLARQIDEQWTAKEYRNIVGDSGFLIRAVLVVELLQGEDYATALDTARRRAWSLANGSDAIHTWSGALGALWYSDNDDALIDQIHETGDVGDSQGLCDDLLGGGWLGGQNQRMALAAMTQDILDFASVDAWDMTDYWDLPTDEELADMLKAWSIKYAGNRPDWWNHIQWAYDLELTTGAGNKIYFFERTDGDDSVALLIDEDEGMVTQIMGEDYDQFYAIAEAQADE